MRLIFWTTLLLGMWLILTANLQIPNILVGVGVSFCVALLYTKMFKHNKFEFINPFWLCIYLFIMAKNLIISNLQIAKKVLSKDMEIKSCNSCCKNRAK